MPIVRLQHECRITIRSRHVGAQKIRILFTSGEPECRLTCCNKWRHILSYVWYKYHVQISYHIPEMNENIVKICAKNHANLTKFVNLWHISVCSPSPGILCSPWWLSFYFMQCTSGAIIKAKHIAWSLSLHPTMNSRCVAVTAIQFLQTQFSCIKLYKDNINRILFFAGALLSPRPMGKKG